MDRKKVLFAGGLLIGLLVLFVCPNIFAQQIVPETQLPVDLSPKKSLPPVDLLTDGVPILWDTHHGVEFGFSPSDKFSAGTTMLELMGYSVDENALGVLNVNLSNYGIIVICEGSASLSAYSVAEVNAIVSFVLQGGGLLILGDNEHTHNANLNPVAQAFGTLCGLSISVPHDTYVTDLNPHAIFSGVTEIYMRAAGEIGTVFPSVEIARHSGEGLVAVARLGFGKVVIVGDINFMDNKYIVESDNAIFAQNIFDWLSVPATSLTIGFDYDPETGEGLPSGSKVDKLWELWGIVVTAHSYNGKGTFGVYAGKPTDHEDVEDNIPVSEPNFIKTCMDENDLTSDAGVFTFEFIEPDTQKRLTANYVSIYFLDLEEPGGGGQGPGNPNGSRLEAYNVNGELLAAVWVPDGPDEGQFFAEIEVPGIHYVKAHVGQPDPNGDSGSLDHFTISLETDGDREGKPYGPSPPVGDGSSGHAKIPE